MLYKLTGFALIGVVEYWNGGVLEWWNVEDPLLLPITPLLQHSIKFKA